MRRLIRSVGLVLIFGLGYFFYAQSNQIKAAAELCQQYVEGAELGKPEEAAKRYGLRLMGPLALPDQPGVERVVFCAPMTMCDTSCAIEYSNGRVTEANYVNF